MTPKKKVHHRGPPKVTTDPEGDAVLWLKVPRKLLARIDAYVETERARTGYPTLARADVVRALLERALPSEKK